MDIILYRSSPQRQKNLDLLSRQKSSCVQSVSTKSLWCSYRLFHSLLVCLQYQLLHMNSRMWPAKAKSSIRLLYKNLYPFTTWIFWIRFIDMVRWCIYCDMKYYEGSVTCLKYFGWVPFNGWSVVAVSYSVYLFKLFSW